MISQILAVFSVLKELINLVKLLMDMVEKNRIVEREAKRQRLDKALEDMKNAKTPQEIMDAQKRIVDNSGD
jgi:regulator of replication initiation timing